MATKKKPAASKKPAAKKPGADGNGGGAETAPQPDIAAQQDPQSAELSILVQYIKDLSFESPNAPVSLQGPGENPKLDVNVNVQASAQSDDIFEVSLNFEANASSDDGVIYKIELVYAGVFRISGVPDHLLQPVLFIDCPTLLFPFMRRIIADMTQEGAFPPLLLDPVDFAGLYRQNAEQIQQTASQPS